MTKEKKPSVKFSDTPDEVIEKLARIACSLHGMKADGPLVLKRGDKVLYDGVAWQSPEMIAKAKVALGVLLPDVLGKFGDDKS